MSRFTRFTRFARYAAAFVLPPAIGAAVGFRALRDRERPAMLPAIDARSAARIPRPRIDPAKPTVVVVLGADLTEITDALGPYEIFARTDRYNVVAAAPERRPTLLTGDLRIVPHYSFAELDARLDRAPAVVVVPNLPNAADAANRPVIRWLRRQAAAGALMHSWCKGAMALAETGLLDGRTATAHWGDLPTLEKRYPRVRWVRGVRWVEDERYVISAGITSGIDASLRVIIRLLGDSVARRVAGEIRYADYRYAIDPTVDPYELRPADFVLLANAAYRVHRPRLGVAMYDGVGEIDLSNVYDAHVHTMAADVETVAARERAIVTAHGLTLLPSLALSAPGAGARLRRLDRLVVPGTAARERADSLTRAAARRAPTLRAEYLHADQPWRFGLEPVLEDLARTADAPTARFAQRRLEYRSPAVRLAGSAVPWRTLGMPAGLGLLGVLAALAASRLAARRRTLVAAGIALLLAAPAGAQRLDSLAPRTRVRADLFTAHESRLRRIFAQPITGALVGMYGDTLLLSVRAGADPLRIPRSALRDVYVSRGRPGRLESALRGALLPALAGAALRGAAAGVSGGDGPSPGRAALQGAAVSAAFAAVKGAIFPRERWRRLDAAALPPSVATR